MSNIHYDESNLPNKSHRREFKSGVTDKELCDAYTELQSIRKVADKFGIAFETVRRRINRHRVDEQFNAEKESTAQFRRLFFDIETSPNVTLTWRTGYKLNIPHDNILKERAIICICYKWEGEDDVYSLTWDDKQCDKEMLEKFVQIANSADELIGHNGDRFDLKWVKTRCLIHRIPMFPKYTTIDTLKIAKKEFYFNSNRLDYIARILGHGGKMETGGFALWKSIVLDSCPESLQTMVDYCIRDVLILEKVFQDLKGYTKHKTHRGKIAGGEKFDCPECASRNIGLERTSYTSAGTQRRHIKCGACGTRYDVSNKTWMDYIQWKIDDQNKSKE